MLNFTLKSMKCMYDKLISVLLIVPTNSPRRKWPPVTAAQSKKTPYNRQNNKKN